MARPMIYNHLTTLASVVTSTTLLYILLSHKPLLDVLYTLFNPVTHPIHFLVLLSIFLLNVKSLPFMWHVRLFRHMGYQFYLQPAKLDTTGAIFKPMIVKGLHSPLLECDYNGHKSNSTYFADADQARTAHVIALFRKGMREASAYDRKRAALLKTSSLPTALVSPTAAVCSAASVAHTSSTTATPSSPPSASASMAKDSSAVKGQYLPILGGVSCHFKREIKPYERYDIWTRVLSWDRKWIYLVSHFVKEGTMQPTEWSLQPWKTSGGRRGDASGISTPGGVGKEEKAAGSGTCTDGDGDGDRDERWKKAVFATSIARYVIKKGRLTVSPEECFNRSNLLPVKLEEHGEKKDGNVDGDIHAWTWENVEAKRIEGMRYAEKFAALEELHEAWPVLKDAPGGKQGAVQVMGEFADMW